ncbi:MAG: MBL fold metallo-hydrolase, partial [Thermoanaerobaculia bacterium]|nr:MBL fold metallo-hydrolase [Thermoanaerobaculia bacterium]
MSRFRTWQIGDVRVTRIVELEMTTKGTWILPDAKPEAVQQVPWVVPHFADAEGRITMSVQALVIESGSRRILVDTCIGNDKERSIPGWNLRSGPFLEDLAEAGFPADSIDTVLCTHLHVDHVGWNTRLEGERWVPTFASARHLITRPEWEHWSVDDDEWNQRILEDS